jgi:hypothetical protein
LLAALPTVCPAFLALSPTACFTASTFELGPLEPLPDEPVERVALVLADFGFEPLALEPLALELLARELL